MVFELERPMQRRSTDIESDMVNDRCFWCCHFLFALLHGAYANQHIWIVSVFHPGIMFARQDITTFAIVNIYIYQCLHSSFFGIVIFIFITSCIHHFLHSSLFAFILFCIHPFLHLSLFVPIIFLYLTSFSSHIFIHYNIQIFFIHHVFHSYYFSSIVHNIF